MHKSTAAARHSGLAVMARYPQPGAVKTRLAKSLGDALTARLYRAFLQDIEHRFGGGPRPLVWVYDPPQADFASVVRTGAICLPQRGETLGERMDRCFVDLLAAGSAGLPHRFDALVMIGADVPHLPAEWVDAAVEWLEEADVVLGPTSDGGYCLVAMSRPHDLFERVVMGTAEVLARTLARAEQLGLRVRQLPMWFDLDEVGDLERLWAMLEVGGDLDLPATASVLGFGGELS